MRSYLNFQLFLMRFVAIFLVFITVHTIQSAHAQTISAKPILIQPLETSCTKDKTH